MIRLTREESRAQTRERVLEAAAAMVAQRGFLSASVRDIAEAAGYSQGAVYSNFGSKEAMLLELMRAHMAQEERELDELMGDAASGSADPMAALARWAQKPAGDETWPILMVEMQLHALRDKAFGEEYRQLIDAHSETVGELIRRLFAKLGKQPPEDAPTVARALIALVSGMALDGHPGCVGETGDMLVRVLGALVLAAPPVE